METKITSDISEAAELIRKGEIVAFPTETVYGLGANALDEEAVAKIFAAKGRPQDNPLIVHVAEKKDIRLYVREVDERAEKVIDAFMPGPITVLFRKKDVIPDSVTAGLGSVGIRMPSHPIGREFIRRCGLPIAAPSANTSTKISPTSAAHVYEDMKGKIPLIVDGGDSEVGIESTIVDMTAETPVILRPGAITADMLAEVLGEVRTFTGKVIKAAPAPGMKYKHYAPSAEMIVASESGVAAAVYDKLSDEGMSTVIIARSREGYGDRAVIALGRTGEEICARIYAAMHNAEKKYDAIICEDFGRVGVCASVMNRVDKASAGRRVTSETIGDLCAAALTGNDRRLL